LRKKLKYNLAGRLLQDVLGGGGEFFMAFIRGRKHNGKLVYVVDPRGVGEVSAVLPIGVEPEEVALFTWDEQKLGIWAAFHHAREYQNGRHVAHAEHALIDIQHQDLDVSIEGNARLSATAQTTFTPLHDGVRVAPFDLFPTLRVAGVWDSTGQALDFIQEDKDDDAQFSVILPHALAKGEAFTIRASYSGKDAVTNEGNGSYYPVARSTWYPNTRFGDYATYDLRFAIPKHLKMVATGARLSDVIEGDKNLTVWKSEAPQAVAGFHLGRFTRLAKKLDNLGIEVESFANTEDENFAGYAAGKGMMQKAMAEAELSLMLYTDYFGPIAYKRVAMTQQMALSFGQAWPGLVWLPRSAFVDATVRHFAGMDDRRGYFKIVGPHEVAHQWWGHTVGFNSYRDQWMSEGFSELSASLYIQLIQKKPKEFIDYWKDQLDLLTEKNAFGFRAADAGPVTMGYRLYTDKTTDIPRRLIYPKGGFILHMVRMLMWDPRTGDARFKAMLHEFVSTYANRAATTEDFKAMLEKHMTPEMDIDGNRSMDWFFDQFVYGTALPSYKFSHTFADDPQQGVVLNVSITQSNVDENFRMRVPIYLELADGRVLRLGSAGMKGNIAIQEKIPLGKVPRPKRAMINHYYDVMAQVTETK
jgi:aminopeptidase N